MPDKDAAIHGLMVVLQRDLAVGKDEYNKFGGYAFRNAEGILKAAKPLVAKMGGRFRIMTRTERLDGGAWMTVEASIVMADGSEETGAASGPVAPSRKGMVEEQLIGSARSYYLKYALMDLLAISDGTDDPDAKDNREAGVRSPAVESKAETSARLALVRACEEYSQATGEDVKAVMVKASKLPEFAKTAEGYLAAASAIRAMAARGQIGE